LPFLVRYQADSSAEVSAASVESSVSSAAATPIASVVELVLAGWDEDELLDESADCGAPPP
jgi:hypothetical protein